MKALKAARKLAAVLCLELAFWFSSEVVLDFVRGLERFGDLHEGER